MTPEELCNAFAAAADEQKNRLEKAASDIDRLREQLAMGLEPTGYRAEWTRESALALVNVLQERCEVFDAQHPQDRASANDCLNVALTLVNMLLNTGGMQLAQVGDGELRIVPL